MSLPLGGWFVVAMLAFWVVHGIRGLLRPPAERQLPYYVGVLLVLYGGVGFFAQALFPMLGPPWITDATELPVLWPVANVRDARGRTIVALESARRVQVYDEHARFLRGWSVGDGRTVRALTSTAADRIEVFVGSEMIVFDGAGKAIERHAVGFEAAGAAKAAITPGDSVTAPVHLWPFANPFVGWGVGAIGMALLWWADSRWPKPFRRR
jgi:hypothetical protein